MVRVVAHKRGQVEGDRKSSSAVFQQIFIALIGFLGRSEAGELAHGEKLAPISGGVNATRVRRLAGIPEILIVILVFGQISLGIKAADGSGGNGGETGVSGFVNVRARGRANRPFR